MMVWAVMSCVMVVFINGGSTGLLPLQVMLSLILVLLMMVLCLCVMITSFAVVDGAGMYGG